MRARRQGFVCAIQQDAGDELRASVAIHGPPRHCERSEAIHACALHGLPRRFAPRKDGAVVIALAVTPSGSRSGCAQKLAQSSSPPADALCASALGGWAGRGVPGERAGGRWPPSLPRGAAPRKAGPAGAGARHATAAAVGGVIWEVLPDSVNTATVPTSSCACDFRLLAAAAISSTSAAFCWVTWSICITASPT